MSRLFDLRMILLSFYPAFMGAHQGSFNDSRFLILLVLFNLAFVARNIFYDSKSLNIEGFYDDQALNSRRINFQGTLLKPREKSPPLLSGRVKMQGLQRILGGVLAIGAGAAFVLRPELNRSEYDICILFSLATVYYAYSPMQLRVGLIFSGLYYVLYNYFVELSSLPSLFIAIFLTTFVLIRIQSWARDSIDTKLKAPPYDAYLSALTFALLFVIVFKGFQFFVPEVKENESVFETLGISKIIERNYQNIKPIVGGISKLPGLNIQGVIDEKVQAKLDKIKESGIPDQIIEFEEEIKSFVKGGRPPESLEKYREALTEGLKSQSRLNVQDVQEMKQLFKNRKFRNLLRSGNIKKEIEDHSELFYKLTQAKGSDLEHLKRTGYLADGEARLAEETKNTLRQMQFDKSFEYQRLREDFKKKVPQIRNQVAKLKPLKNKGQPEKKSNPLVSEVDQYLDKEIKRKLPEDFKKTLSKEEIESESLVEALSEFFSKTWSLILLVVCLVLLLKFVSIRKVIGAIDSKVDDKKKAPQRAHSLSQRYLALRNSYQGRAEQTNEAYRLCLDLLDFLKHKKPEHLPPSYFVERTKENRPELAFDIDRVTAKFSDNVFGQRDLEREEQEELLSSMANIYKKFEEKNRLSFK